MELYHQPQDLSLTEVIFTRLLTSLNYVLPDVGCPNGCGHCSVSASANTTSIDVRSVRNVFAGIKAAADTNPEHPTVAGLHKGRLHAYFDNDPGAFYPGIADYVEISHRELGVRTRLTSTGWSRHDPEMQAAHDRIAQMPEALHSYHMSLTPFTRSWRDTANPLMSREELAADMANGLNTYSRLKDRLEPGNFGVLCSFEPHLETYDKPLDQEVIRGRHVIHSGPYILVQADEAGESEGDRTDYLLFTSDKQLREGDWRAFVEAIPDELEVADGVDVPFEGSPDDTLVRKVHVTAEENEDGPYWEVDQEIGPHGYQSMQFYEQTERRRHSGHWNMTRPFLNALVGYKTERGGDETLDDAQWSDVDALVNSLRSEAESLDGYDSARASYIEEGVLPLVELLAVVLKRSGLPPTDFFDRRFVVDFGQVLNQGRAHSRFFRNIASRPYLPLDAKEARINSMFASRGNTWRVAPVPPDEDDDDSSELNGFIRIEEVDSYDRQPTGQGVTVPHVVTASVRSLPEAIGGRHMPGSVPVTLKPRAH